MGTACCLFGAVVSNFLQWHRCLLRAACREALQSLLGDHPSSWGREAADTLKSHPPGYSPHDVKPSQLHTESNAANRFWEQQQCLLQKPGCAKSKAKCCKQLKCQIECCSEKNPVWASPTSQFPAAVLRTRKTIEMLACYCPLLGKRSEQVQKSVTSCLLGSRAQDKPALAHSLTTLRKDWLWLPSQDKLIFLGLFNPSQGNWRITALDTAFTGYRGLKEETEIVRWDCWLHGDRKDSSAFLTVHLIIFHMTLPCTVYSSESETYSASQCSPIHRACHIISHMPRNFLYGILTGTVNFIIKSNNLQYLRAKLSPPN